MATVTREREEMIDWLTDAVARLPERHELGDVRDAIAAALASGPPAAPPEDARELAVARHELALIEAQTKRGVTDCSTPLPQRVQNIVEALAKAEREIKRLTAASAAPPDPPGLLSRGQARAIHIMTNVAHARNGRVLFACDGPDCQVCADLTLLALPRALSPLAARQSDPPGLAQCPHCGGKIVERSSASNT